MKRVVVVTAAHGRTDHLRRQQQWLRKWSPDVLHVVVAMGDRGIDDAVAGAVRDGHVVVRHMAADPRRLPVARARNLGATEALARGATVLVFLDVDCLPSRQLLPLYAEHARDGLVLSGPVTYLPEGVLPPSDAGAAWFAGVRAPHPARPDPPFGRVVEEDDPALFWSLSFAVTASTWQEVGGFCEDYCGYGAEDTDFAQLARSAGARFAWMGGADAFHQHHPVSDPPVEHLHDILRNGRLYRDRWGTWPMEGWMHEFAARGLVIREGDEWCLPPAS